MSDRVVMDSDSGFALCTYRCMLTPVCLAERKRPPANIFYLYTGPEAHPLIKQQQMQKFLSAALDVEPGSALRSLGSQETSGTVHVHSYLTFQMNLLWKVCSPFHSQAGRLGRQMTNELATRCVNRRLT